MFDNNPGKFDNWQTLELEEAKKNLSNKITIRRCKAKESDILNTGDQRGNNNIYMMH